MGKREFRFYLGPSDVATRAGVHATYCKIHPATQCASRCACIILRVVCATFSRYGHCVPETAQTPSTAMRLTRLALPGGVPGVPSGSPAAFPAASQRSVENRREASSFVIAQEAKNPVGRCGGPGGAVLVGSAPANMLRRSGHTRSLFRVDSAGGARPSPARSVQPHAPGELLGPLGFW